MFRFEFIRRKNGGISYTPQQSSSLDDGAWQAATGAVDVSTIDDNWERVVITQPLDTSRFIRVVVDLDE